LDTEGTGQVQLLEDSLPHRVGAVFQLLMHVRMLIAAITLLLLPRGRLTVGTFSLVLSVFAVSWVVGKYWKLIVPRLLAHPLLVALDICVSFAVLGIGGPTGPFFLSTVVTAAVAGLLYRWQGMVLVAGLQILCYYSTLRFLPTAYAPSSTTFQTLIGQPIYYPIVGFAGLALRKLFDDQAADEAARNVAEVAAAAAEERTRLAREMHDSLAKTLRGIAMSAAALPVWVERDPVRATDEAQRIASATEVASREARSLIKGLRMDAIVRPLPEAIRECAREWATEQSTAVRCTTDTAAELPLLARHELIAILMEVLSNAERHADASSVTIDLVAEQGDVVLTVCDDGHGFEVKELTTLAREGHYGLVGLHERAQRVGGQLAVASRPGEGTTVTVRIPMEPTPAKKLAEVS